MLASEDRWWAGGSCKAKLEHRLTSVQHTLNYVTRISYDKCYRMRARFYWLVCVARSLATDCCVFRTHPPLSGHLRFRRLTTAARSRWNDCVLVLIIVLREAWTTSVVTGTVLFDSATVERPLWLTPSNKGTTFNNPAVVQYDGAYRHGRCRPLMGLSQLGSSQPRLWKLG